MSYIDNDIEANEKSDSKLYQEFCNGSQEAFNEIVKKYRKSMIYFIMRYVKNLEVAEDLAQDAFVYVLINKKEYDFKCTLKTYLYTIAKCRAINYIKRQSKIIKFDESYISDLEKVSDIDDGLLKEELRRETYEAIRKLKLDYQIVIYLKDYQGFQYKEICKILNKTMPQTKMLISRARKALSKILRKGRDKC